MRITSLRLITAAALMAACAGVVHAQDAQSVLRPLLDRPQPPCDVSMTVIFSSDALGNVTFDASGIGTPEVTKVTPETEPAGNTQTIKAMHTEATNDLLGTITWSLAAPNADGSGGGRIVINANQFGADFPATADIYFTPEATISSQPGVVYRAEKEVHLQSTNLQSFSPQQNEGYTLVDGKIDFDDAATGVHVFTIQLENITIGSVPDELVLRPYIGDRIRCVGNFSNNFSSPELGQYTFDASVDATFETQTVTTAAEAAGNTQRTVSLDATATVDVLGTITWHFGNEDATATSITANQVGANFPATSDIYFRPVATISSRPGVRYVATREVHFQNTNLTSFDPQKGESYTLLDGPIDFVDDATQAYAFTIDVTNLVLGDDGGGKRQQGNGNLLSKGKP